MNKKINQYTLTNIHVQAFIYHI